MMLPEKNAFANLEPKHDKCLISHYSSNCPDIMQRMMSYLVLTVFFCFGCVSPPHADFNQGVILMHLNKYDEAEKAFQQTVKDNPHNAEAWNQLGIISFERENYDKAETYFQRALNLNPQNASYHRNLGIVLAEKRDLDIAKRMIKRAIALEPTEADNFTTLAKVEILLRDKDSAIEALDQALKLDPSDKEARELRAQLRK